MHTKTPKNALKNFTALLLFIAGTNLFYQIPAHAELTNPDLPDRKGVKTSPIIVHMAAKSAVTFDTNIFLTRKSPQYDMITLVNPSVGIELPLGDHRLSADYEVGMNFFGHYVHQNYADHKVRGLAEFKLNDYKVTVQNVYRRFSSRSNSEDTNRVRQQTNDLRFDFGRERGKVKFNLSYWFGVENYISKETLYLNMRYKDKNKFRNEISAKAGYQVINKTWAIVESVLGYLDYPSDLNPNSVYVEELLGVEGEYGDSLKYSLKGGIRYQNYDKADLVINHDFIGFVGRGLISYFLTDKDVFDVSIEREVYESTFDNMNYYVLNFLGIDYTHKFNKKWLGKVYGLYQINMYPTSTVVSDESGKRYDNFFGGGCGLRYDVNKWMSFEAKYDCIYRKSKFKDFDYIDNLFTIRGTAGF